MYMSDKSLLKQLQDIGTAAVDSQTSSLKIKCQLNVRWHRRQSQFSPIRVSSIVVSNKFSSSHMRRWTKQFGRRVCRGVDE